MVGVHSKLTSRFLCAALICPHLGAPSLQCSAGDSYFSCILRLAGDYCCG